MKIKPIVSDRIQTRHTSFRVDLQLESNITFIIGDSGTGKSALFSFIQELSVDDTRIKCINYLDQSKNYKASIKRYIGKLLVIDNADVLLDNEMRSYIATDEKNQYIIIGRNPTGLLLTQDEIYEICSTKDEDKIIFSLVKSF